MRIQRVQKGGAGNAVGAAALKAGGIHGTRIATDDVVTAAARIIGIVDSKLRVIKNIESLRPKLKLAALPNLDVLKNGKVKVEASGIVQIVTASVSEREPPRSHKLRRIADERAETFGIVEGRWQTFQYVGVRGRNTQAAGNAGVVGHGNARVSGTVDHRKRRARLSQRYSRKLPTVENPVRQRQTTVCRGRCRILWPIVRPV